MSKKVKNISVISTGSWVPPDLNNEYKAVQTYNVQIEKLQLDASIGIHDHEKQKKQKISISLSIKVNDNIADVDENINNFVSYENVINNIKLIINEGHIDLVETLAYRILQCIFIDARALFVWLKIEKLEVFEESHSVGIEISKTRDDFKQKISLKKLNKFKSR